MARDPARVDLPRRGAPRPPRVGERLSTCISRAGGALRRQVGASAIESLIALPVCLMLGASAWQWALLMHARASAEYALQQGARRAAVLHGSPDAVVAALGLGLVPFWGGDLARMSTPLAEPLAAQRAERAIGEGWLQWRQVSPDSRAFDDWSEPARSADGDVVEGGREIPNDNLRYRSAATGARSGLDLVEANVLQLEMVYAVPLQVPLVGRLIARTMQALDGCVAPSQRRLGMVAWDDSAGDAGSGWRCPFYEIRGWDSASTYRLPVRVRAWVRMQSPLRHMASARANQPASAEEASGSDAPPGPPGGVGPAGANGPDAGGGGGDAAGSAPGGSPSGSTDADPGEVAHGSGAGAGVETGSLGNPAVCDA